MLQTWACSKAKGVHRGFQRSDDCITVFLNYKQLASFKDKASALGYVRKLLADCPLECKKEFEAWAPELLGVIDGTKTG
jgi:hypothetical protein